MSALARDAAAFKSSLHRQDFTSWHSNATLKPGGRPGPAAGSSQQQASASSSATSPTSSSTPLGQQKKKPKPNIVYSQPADTGSGQDINTQIIYAVEHLKHNGNPMRLLDLAIHSNIPLDQNGTLLDRFKAHDRVVWDVKTDLYSYKHDFTFRNKAALLTEIQRHTRRGGGLSVRALKDSWKEAPQAIEELEKEGDVLVTRTTKDQQMRMAFWNEIKPIEGTGGMAVDQEFKDMWKKLKVPAEADLLKALSSEGLKATEAESVIPKGLMGKKKGKKTNKSRPMRITNVHLKGDIDLSRDYVPPAK